MTKKEKCSYCGHEIKEIPPFSRKEIEKVTSLEMSKRLRQAGWKWPTEKYWCVPYHDNGYMLREAGAWLADKTQPYSEILGAAFAAPTADSILSEMPERKESVMPDGRRCVTINGLHDAQGEYGRTETGMNRADAAAAMWIYLKENPDCLVRP